MISATLGKNTTQPRDVWDRPVFEELFREVRDANASLWAPRISAEAVSQFRWRTTMDVDWHGGHITRMTQVDQFYKNTQNVRRFLTHECDPDFRFNRDFMAWIRNGTRKSIGDVADEWIRRRRDRT